MLRSRRIVKAQQLLAPGRAGAAAAIALDGVLNEREGQYFGLVGKGGCGHDFRSVSG